jgi:type I restriction enzyme R subunit
LRDIIKNFISFSADAKILGAYHQYFAVRKAVASTAKETGTDGKVGVFWYAQISGKSLSVVF